MARTRQHGPMLKRRGHRALIYVRVSNYQDGDKLSPELQLRENLRFCEHEGLTVVAVEGLTEAKYGDTPIVEDLDLSGRSSGKRKISKMIEAVRKNKADVVVVWKVSRWGRGMLDASLNLQALEAAGGFLYSATEGVNDAETATGKYSRSQMLLLAQLQSDQIGEGWANLREFRVGQGKPATGGPRWGYTQDKENDAYVIDENLAPLVKECYRRYIEDEPAAFASIARYLDDRDQVTTQKTPWTGGTLRVFLDSGFAAGLIIQRKKERDGKDPSPANSHYAPGAHEAIIDSETWERYKARRVSLLGKGRAAPPRDAVHALSGLIFCASCESRMILDGAKGKNRYFRCNRNRSQKYATVGRCLSSTLMRDLKVEEHVREWVASNRTTDVDVHALIERERAARKATTDTEKIKREIKYTEDRRSRAYNMLIDGKIPDQALYEEEDAKMASSIQGLKDRLREAERAARVNAIPEKTAFDAIDGGWGKMKPEHMNAALRQVIRRVEITRNPDGTKGVRVIAMWED